MAGLSPETILNYEYGSYKGFFAENFVATELLISHAILIKKTCHFFC
jgi:hypothetical protein